MASGLPGHTLGQSFLNEAKEVGDSMAAVTPGALETTDRRVAARVERVFRKYAGHPLPYFHIPLAVVTTGVVAFGLSTARDRLVVVALTLLAAGWFQAWFIFKSRQDTPGRRLIFRLGTFVGCVLMAWLVSYSIFYCIVIVPLFVRLFLELPLVWSYPAGLLMLIPLDLEFREVSQLGSSRTVFATIAIIRAIILMAVGILVKTLLSQVDEKQRLLDEQQRLLDQLSQTERKTGMLEERQRLAREIHDTLAQGFAAILAHLETAELGRDNGGDRESEVQHIASARRVARDSLEEARRMMAALRPEILETADLPAAMARIADGWSSRTGLPCTASVTGTPGPLHRDIEVALLRTAQEALANAWKHARPSRVSITLSYMGDLVVLDVQDDGVGGAGTGGFGFGLRSMRERMEQIGGTFTVESTPGEGTTISASAPNVVRTVEIPFYRQGLLQT
jgi:signal transduction histidine kinase